MSCRAGGMAVAAVCAALCAEAAAAQTVPETFTATATVQRGSPGGASTHASASFIVTITRYASDDERAAVMQAVREGGTAALRKTLSTLRDAGVIQLGERRTPVKFAGERTTEAGRLITVVTAQPILYLGPGLAAAKPRAGFDVAIAMLDLKAGDTGLGELVPAAKVGLDDGGALLIDDYGSAVVWLEGLTRAR
jgi:hypothetical protein